MHAHITNDSSTRSMCFSGDVNTALSLIFRTLRKLTTFCLHQRRSTPARKIKHPKRERERETRVHEKEKRRGNAKRKEERRNSKGSCTRGQNIATQEHEILPFLWVKRGQRRRRCCTRAQRNFASNGRAHAHAHAHTHTHAHTRMERALREASNGFLE